MIFITKITNCLAIKWSSKILFEYQDTQFYFSRIPRTASRNFYSIAKANNIIPRVADVATYANLFGTSKLKYLKKEFFHVDLKTAKLMFDLPDRKFAILRNPVERFKSAFLINGYVNRIYNIEQYDSYEQFYFLMESQKFERSFQATNCITKDPSSNFYVRKEDTFVFNFEGLKNSFTNWFLPQHNYIDDSFDLWKFENKFEEKFYDWFTKTFKIKLDIKKRIDEYEKFRNDNKVDFQLSKQFCNNIEKYYCDDMELWESIGRVY